MMNYLSVCSGVEAASQAWHALGWNPVAFSEIEPFPCAVLASRFPQVPNLGDMCKIHYNRETKELYNDTTRLVCPGGIDLLVGGTPCQSFSFAGRREGLKGASGLAYHFVRLLGEIKPRWFVWENVPGALSSVTDGQRDFNFLVRQYAECGYDIEWRVLDTQYVRTPRFPRAIPQRRRRVFVVGHHSAAGSSGCQVLLEQEGLRGYPPPRRVKGKGFTKTADGCLELAGEPVALRGNRNESARGKLPETDEGGAAYTVTGVQTDSMLCVKETHYSDVISIQDMVRTNKRQNGCGYSQSGASYTCDSISMQGVACRIDPISSAKGVDCYNQSLTGDVSMTIACAAATDKNHIGAVAIGIGRDAFNSGKNAKMDMSISQDVMPPQTARGGGGSDVEWRNSNGDDVMPTIDTRICAGVNLQLEDNGGYLCGSENMVNVIRRITPIEGERLQGFADNWTRPCFTQEQINDDNLVDQFVEVFKNWNDINGLTTKAKNREAVRKWMTTISSSDCPDGPRYKAIGNSMSVNVMEWIGLKIEREERRRNNQ